MTIHPVPPTHPLIRSRRKAIISTCLRAQARPSAPANPNQLAKLITDIAAGEADDKREDGKNPHAVALGRLGAEMAEPAGAIRAIRQARPHSARRQIEHPRLLRFNRPLFKLARNCRASQIPKQLGYYFRRTMYKPRVPPFSAFGWGKA